MSEGNNDQQLVKALREERVDDEMAKKEREDRRARLHGKE